MKDENYFEVKLASAKETLSMAERKLEHLDLQILKLQERFDHDKKVYDDQAKHMQAIVTDMKKRIPNLEKKLSEGYSHFDLKSGKAYKSFEAIHEGQLLEKIEWAEENAKLIQENWERTQALRKKRHLSEKERQEVDRELVRESLQPPEELKVVREQEQQKLEEKAEFYRQQLEELKEKADHKEVPIEMIIEEKVDIANQMREMADDMNHETYELERILDEHKDWIERYGQEEGGHAVWQGRITNGFRAWCKEKGFKLPE